MGIITMQTVVKMIALYDCSRLGRGELFWFCVVGNGSVNAVCDGSMVSCVVWVLSFVFDGVIVDTCMSIFDVPGLFEGGIFIENSAYLLPMPS